MRIKTMSTTSILIADAQYLIRLGLKHLLSDHNDLTIIDEAVDEEDLLEQLAKYQPDVTILDYNQKDSFSVQTLRQIKNIAPQTNILIISADNDKGRIYEVLELGIINYLTKSCDEEEIIDAIHATAKGEKFFCNKVLDFIVEKSFPRENSCAPTPLTPRELEIAKMVSSGLLSKEIAQQLNLSTHTVYTHRKNIMRKLKLNSTSELVLYAVNKGIIAASYMEA